MQALLCTPRIVRLAHRRGTGGSEVAAQVFRRLPVVCKPI